MGACACACISLSLSLCVCGFCVSVRRRRAGLLMRHRTSCSCMHVCTHLSVFVWARVRARGRRWLARVPCLDADGHHQAVLGVLLGLGKDADPLVKGLGARVADAGDVDGVAARHCGAAAQGRRARSATPPPPPPQPALHACRTQCSKQKPEGSLAGWVVNRGRTRRI